MGRPFYRRLSGLLAIARAGSWWSAVLSRWVCWHSLICLLQWTACPGYGGISRDMEAIFGADLMRCTGRGSVALFLVGCFGGVCNAWKSLACRSRSPSFSGSGSSGRGMRRHGRLRAWLVYTGVPDWSGFCIALLLLFLFSQQCTVYGGIRGERGKTRRRSLRAEGSHTARPCLDLPSIRTAPTNDGTTTLLYITLRCCTSYILLFYSPLQTHIIQA